MTDIKITEDIDTLKIKTWVCRSPIRFVERDGKRILQHPKQCLETGEIEWVDVPLEVEQ